MFHRPTLLVASVLALGACRVVVDEPVMHVHSADLDYAPPVVVESAPVYVEDDRYVIVPGREELVVVGWEPEPVLFERGGDFVVVVEGGRHVRYGRSEWERRDRERIGRNEKRRIEHVRAHPQQQRRAPAHDQPERRDHRDEK